MYNLSISHKINQHSTQHDQMTETIRKKINQLEINLHAIQLLLLLNYIKFTNLNVMINVILQLYISKTITHIKM